MAISLTYVTGRRAKSALDKGLLAVDTAAERLLEIWRRLWRTPDVDASFGVRGWWAKENPSRCLMYTCWPTLA